MTVFFNNLLLGEISHFKTHFKSILSNWKTYSYLPKSFCLWETPMFGLPASHNGSLVGN